MGPSTRGKKILERMVAAGMDMARINASHAQREEIEREITLLKEVREETGKPLAIMLDLMGPKIRVGEIEGGSVYLRQGESITLTTRKVLGNSRRVSINCAALPCEFKVGDSVLLDDGAIRLRVEEVRKRELVCRVEVGGELKSHKGVNFPAKLLRLPSLTQKDVSDLKLGLSLGVDWVALSFVRSSSDIKNLRRVIGEIGGNQPIMAKIEKSEALSDIEEILRAADAIMVARGDLGVERPIEEVPLLQKGLIERAAHQGKPVVVATQMLESMIHQPVPTRAEASDIANALLDGADALMLSAETAVGAFPVEAVRTMAKIMRRTEEDLPYSSWMEVRRVLVEHGPVEATCFAACELARNVRAKAIMAPTDSGFTALQMARFRPESAIIALTPRQEVANRLMVAWGVYPVVVGVTGSVEEMFRTASQAALQGKWARKGDYIVITAGIKDPGAAGTTNMIKLQKV
jgi:pyruvate kinase